MGIRLFQQTLFAYNRDYSVLSSPAAADYAAYSLLQSRVSLAI
jgi:hypothetical protein